MEPVHTPSEGLDTTGTDALEEVRRDNRYANTDPDTLSEKIYEDVDAEDAFDKIDRLLDAETRTVSYDHSGTYSVAVGYPDVYENGIANLSHQVVYKHVNEQDDWYATRTYEPSTRLKKALVKEQRPYFTWEDRKPLHEHDIVTFTLSFEELAPKMLSILDYADFPMYAEDRSEDDPLVICGGTTPNYNPEPYVDFVDCFYIGEAEIGVTDILDTYEEAREQGYDRDRTLQALADVRAVYVPELYEVEYDEETGELLDMVALEPEAAGQIYKTVDEDLTEHPAHSIFITPHVIYDEACFTLEVQRGCAYSCNFCQYGHNNRSSRWMDVDSVIEFVEENAVEHADIVKLFYEATSPGYLDDLFKGIDWLETEYDIDIRLGAFTANQLTERMVRVAAEGGQQCIIVAPETASGDMRFAIGKEGFYDDEEVFKHARWAAKHGVPNFGLYLLLGIPGETKSDIEDLADFVGETREHTNEDGVLEVHVNPVFPKPLTPFQWSRMERPGRSVDKLNHLVDTLDSMGYNVVVDCVSKAVIGAGYLNEEEQGEDTDIVVKTVSGTKMHYSQPILSRGDRRIGEVLYDAYVNGDSYTAWREAMEKAGIDDEIYFRERNVEETLPWEYIHNNVEPAVRENKWESARNRAYSENDD